MSKKFKETLRYIGRLTVILNIFAPFFWFIYHSFQIKELGNTNQVEALGIIFQATLASHVDSIFLFGGWVGIAIMICLVLYGLWDFINHDEDLNDPYISSYGDDYP